MARLITSGAHGSIDKTLDRPGVNHVTIIKTDEPTRRFSLPVSWTRVEAELFLSFFSFFFFFYTVIEIDQVGRKCISDELAKPSTSAEEQLRNI